MESDICVWAVLFVFYVSGVAKFVSPALDKGQLYGAQIIVSCLIKAKAGEKTD